MAAAAAASKAQIEHISMRLLNHIRTDKYVIEQ